MFFFSLEGVRVDLPACRCATSVAFCPPPFPRVPPRCYLSGGVDAYIRNLACKSAACGSIDQASPGAARPMTVWFCYFVFDVHT